MWKDKKEWTRVRECVGLKPEEAERERKGRRKGVGEQVEGGDEGHEKRRSVSVVWKESLGVGG